MVVFDKATEQVIDDEIKNLKEKVLRLQVEVVKLKRPIKTI